MPYRLPPGLAAVRRNPHGPARFTGNFLPWIAEIEGRVTYCSTRDSARATVAEYRAERARLIRDGLKAQARAQLYDWRAEK